MSRLLCADLHIGKSTVNDGEMQAVLNFIKTTALERGCTHLDILGDLLDNRSLMMFRIWPQVQRWFDELVASNIKVTILAGNHDFYNTDHRAPSNLRSLRINPEVYIIDTIEDDGQILWIPWLFPGETIPESQSVIFAHLSINSFKFTKQVTVDTGVDPALFKKPVYTGHFHTPQISGEIRYLGNPIHHTWNDANDKKYIYLLNDALEVEEAISTNHIFTNLVIIDYNNITAEEVVRGSKVSVRNVPYGSEDLTIKAILALGASSVECVCAESETVSEESTASVITVDDAIEALIGVSPMCLELKEFHQRMKNE